MMAAPSVIFLMADYGHDPTETALPWKVFHSAGWTISFATETGTPPACDARMLTGATGTLLGAPATAKRAYAELARSFEFTKPLLWGHSPRQVSLEAYDLVFLPGGHDKAIRQIIDSPVMSKLLGTHFPRAAKPSKTFVAAICHGVQVLAAAQGEDGKSVLHNARTTALPGMFESGIYQATRLFLGDYYKTYGAGTANVEEVVRGKLDQPEKQFVCSWSATTPLVVEDPKYNYLSGRFPLDAEPLAKRAVELVNEVRVAS